VQDAAVPDVFGETLFSVDLAAPNKATREIAAITGSGAMLACSSSTPLASSASSSARPYRRSSS